MALAQSDWAPPEAGPGPGRRPPGTECNASLRAANSLFEASAAVTWRVRGWARVDRSPTLVEPAATWGRGVSRLVHGTPFRQLLKQCNGDFSQRVSQGCRPVALA
ncbi:serine hydroxymethyltransferase 1 [Rhinolophus ferrumequinum]|uniref:Serine hydroxymethyltransferase 1 n=1 Tax=Rhinolophus ferrumequinum TaxID=59479 RepID=A0A7J7TGX6_RHIFE|nr:serine hydroxymethyltransferase 1 [Rhinolophus ferrumequinum]